MTKTIRFYKERYMWYADVPEYIEQGGIQEDLMMVSGADTWLDIISNKSNEVTIEMSTTEVLQEKLVIVDRPEDKFVGVTYIANSFQDEDVNHLLWLCPVTIFVFDEYPEVIHYRIMKWSVKPTSFSCGI
jgi:hypothetical protein